MSESCRDVCDIVIRKLVDLGFPVQLDRGEDHSAVMAALPEVEFVRVDDYRINEHSFTPAELLLINKLQVEAKWTDFTFARKSQRAFDIQVEGRTGRFGEPPTKFSAWLPLAALGAVTWPKSEIWDLVDAYGGDGPDDPEYRDWSGIRDSSTKVQWEMFAIALRELVPEG